ncbi:hypothetical protein OfM1_05690 [Lactovum odontotermitis]
MNYYKQELERIRRNFRFSLGIYDRQPLLQKVLCREMMTKLKKFRIPKQFSFLFPVRKEIYDEIQNVYVALKNGQIIRKEDLPRLIDKED